MHGCIRRCEVGKVARKELTKLCFSAHRNIPFDEDTNEYFGYLELYYHLKALKRIGFKHEVSDYHPEVLEHLVFIECQLSKFESDDLKRDSEQQRNRKPAYPNMPRPAPRK